MDYKTTVPKTYSLVVMLVLILPAAYSMAAPEPVVEPNASVVDSYLRDVLDRTSNDQSVEVIVQFSDEVFLNDRSFVKDLGFEVLYKYSIVPALWLKGPPRAIDALSAYDRTVWIEYNEELEWLMDETTNVINATTTWTSQIEGSLWGDSGFDGTGVTVVVVDSGIDAGHPDLDYGTKTIRNLKSDTGTGPWYEIENGDTSSGHGTHVAGTVAGNGDASAGSRAGVAPGANLIGLSVGEAVFVTGGLGGRGSVYEKSRPGNNPYNIRVVTNSWGGGGGQYDPQDSISQAINNLVYDNNVVVSFAAGNSGGDGNTIQASNYGNTPSAIGVAASGRDGTYVTDFSSKGMWNWVDTWPDITAPGHYIESTAARRTLISGLNKGSDVNPYYLAISGTSMATPHIAGAAAVIFQAAPSLRVSDVIQDAGLVVEEDGSYTVVSPDEGSYGDLAYNYDEWMGEALDTRIHELELILKLTADYIPPQGEGSVDSNGLTENWVPSWNVPGLAAERQHDFSQGYGLFNLHKAVGLALTVERIRWEHPEATVLDAYQVYEDIFEYKEVSVATDTLTTSWSGEWSRFTENPFKPATFTSNLTRFVIVPEGAEEATVSMSYSPVDTTKLLAGSLGFKIDYGNDGSFEYDSGLGPSRDGSRSATIAISGDDGKAWRIEIYGVGFKIQRPLQDIQYQEARMEVEMTVGIKFPSGPGSIMVNQTDMHAINAFLRPSAPSQDYTGGNMSMMRNVYNLNSVQWTPVPETPSTASSSGFSWWWVLALFLFLLVAAFIIARFFPETKAGQMIIKVSNATGATKVYHITHDTTLKGYSKVRGAIPVGKKPVVMAEVVDETGEMDG